MTTSTSVMQMRLALEHLAGIAVFLESAASDFVTGAAIPVDGGYSISG